MGPHGGLLVPSAVLLSPLRTSGQEELFQAFCGEKEFYLTDGDHHSARSLACRRTRTSTWWVSACQVPTAAAFTCPGWQQLSRQKATIFLCRAFHSPRLAHASACATITSDGRSGSVGSSCRSFELWGLASLALAVHYGLRVTAPVNRGPCLALPCLASFGALCLAGHHSFLVLALGFAALDSHALQGPRFRSLQGV